MRRGANDAGQGKRSRSVKVKCTLSAVIMLFIINNHSSDPSIHLCFSKYFIMGAQQGCTDGRVAMKGWPYMYVGLEPIQSPKCRPADTLPTPPYMHPCVHPYILTIRYKALPPKSPYTVPYTGFWSLISKFQVLRHRTEPSSCVFNTHNPQTRYPLS
jgi:hypothetical protein